MKRQVGHCLVSACFCELGNLPCDNDAFTIAVTQEQINKLAEQKGQHRVESIRLHWWCHHNSTYRRWRKCAELRRKGWNCGWCGGRRCSCPRRCFSCSLNLARKEISEHIGGVIGSGRRVTIPTQNRRQWTPKGGRWTAVLQQAMLPVRLLRRLVETELASNRLDPTTAIVGCATPSVATLQSESLSASVEPRRRTTDAMTETLLWSDGDQRCLEVRCGTRRTDQHLPVETPVDRVDWLSRV